MRLEVLNPRVKLLMLLYTANPVREWQGVSPGDIVQLVRDSRYFGTVVGVQDDENVLVLWSRVAQHDHDATMAASTFKMLRSGLISKQTMLQTMGFDDPT